MKLYKIEYSANTPSPIQINVEEDSPFSVGVKLIKDGSTVTLSASQVTIECGSTTLTGSSIFASEYVKIDVPMQLQPAMSSAKVKISKDGTNYAFDLICNITKSSVAEVATQAEYDLPKASTTTLGGIKVGDNLSIDANGVLSAASGSSYELPIASSSTLGGIKVGDNLSIDANGVLSASGGTTYELPIATASTLGGIKIGSGMTITDGVVSIDKQNYSTVTKTASTIEVDDNAINMCSDAVSAITVPSTIHDTVAYVATSSITWDFSAWDTIKSDDSDVFTFTAPALFTFTALDADTVLVMKKNLVTVTL